ncbi:hypothetical protein D3C73_492000 [compost metagenome]
MENKAVLIVARVIAETSDRCVPCHRVEEGIARIDGQLREHTSPIVHGNHIAVARCLWMLGSHANSCCDPARCGLCLKRRSHLLRRFRLSIHIAQTPLLIPMPPEIKSFSKKRPWSRFLLGYGIVRHRIIVVIAFHRKPRKHKLRISLSAIQIFLLTSRFIGSQQCSDHRNIIAIDERANKLFLAFSPGIRIISQIFVGLLP